MLAEVRTGPVTSSDGAVNPARSGKDGGLVTTDLHGRFYEQNSRGGLFSGGMTMTSISNVTFTTATLGATATPIAGVYNPSTSLVNVVVLQAIMAVTMTALQNTGCGGFMWCTSVGNPGLTLGTTPLNRRTLVASGSSAKDMAGIALTGLTNNLAIRSASALMGGSSKALAELDTAIGMTTAMTGSPIEAIDGAFIVPPGGVLALLCTTTPVAHSACSGLVWEEVAI